MSAAAGYVTRAQALMAVGRHEDAIPLLRRAIADEPQAAQLRYLLGDCLLELGQPEEALRMAESALGLDPEFGSGHQLRSRALRELGRKTEALASAEEAVRLSPVDAAAVLTLGHAELECKLLDQAWTSGEQVVALAPAESAGHVLLGLVAIEQKEWRVAESECREALRINPRDYAAMNNLGLVYQHQRKHKQAIEAFENAARLNPRSDLVRNNLFQQTWRYLIGASGVVLFFVIRGVIVSRAYLNPVAIATALVLTAAGILLLFYVRHRQLSRTVRTFYQAEQRRQWLQTWGYLASLYFGWLAILLLGYAAYQTSRSSGGLLLLVLGLVAWWYGWPRIWRGAILPRLRARSRR